MFYIDVMDNQNRSVETLSADVLNPVTGLNYARHHSLSLCTMPHRHTFMEIFLVTDGAIAHLVNGDEELLRPGEARLIRAADAHCYKRVEGQPCELFNVAFGVPFYLAAREALGAEASFDAMLAAAAPPRLSLAGEELGQSAGRLELCRDGLVANPKKAALRIKALLMDFLAAFAAAFAEEGAPEHADMPQWMADACAALKERRLYLKGAPELLRLARRSHEHVCREFIRVLGTTPTDYVNGHRLNHAAALLTGSDDKIQSVALDSGFESLSHFHHLFKRKFGASPAKYRATARRPAIPRLTGHGHRAVPIASETMQSPSLRA